MTTAYELLRESGKREDKLDEMLASRALDQCSNTLDLLKLGHTMLRCTHASHTLLEQMQDLIEAARVELDLSDD